MIDPTALAVGRVTVSKILLFVVALFVAYLAAQKPAVILFLVSAAFAFEAASFFFRTQLWYFPETFHRPGSRSWHDDRFGFDIYCILTFQPWLRSTFATTSPIHL